MLLRFLASRWYPPIFIQRQIADFQPALSMHLCLRELPILYLHIKSMPDDYLHALTECAPLRWGAAYLMLKGVWLILLLEITQSNI